MKRTFSSKGLVVVLAALVVLGNFERAFGQIPCTNLSPPHQCSGFGPDRACFGLCTPIDCPSYQTGSTCSCISFLPSTAPDNDCQNSQTRSCGCVVDCTQLDPNARCSTGAANQCTLRFEQCIVDCAARGQTCTSAPGFGPLNSNTICLITQGGTCTTPTTTSATPTTTAASTTTAAPATTTAAQTTTYATYTNPSSSYTQSAATYATYTNPSSSYTQAAAPMMPYSAPGFMPYSTPYQPYPFFYNPTPPYASQRSPLYDPQSYGYRWDNRPNYFQNYQSPHQHSGYSRYPSQNFFSRWP